MGKTKIKTIDDSQPVEEVKKVTPKKKGDSLVAKLKKELGITEEAEKVQSVKTIGEVESALKEGSAEESASQQTHSEAEKPSAKQSTSKPSDALRPDEQPEKQAIKSKPRSKTYQEKAELVEKTKTYPLNEAIELVKQLSYSKFDGTLEAHLNTTQTGIRGLVSLPYTSGKKLRILAFGKGAEGSGADMVGDDNTLEEILNGKVGFDLLITTPEWMPKLAKVAKTLGPRGLMPNPKNGTITEDLKKAVEGFQAGKTEYKSESKAPLIHQPLGKLNQPPEELGANVKTLIQTIGKTKIKKVTLSPTIGPSVKVDLGSI